ncbi:MAG: sulfur carrier protein ThiS [Candidatus Hydrogenedentota bacterium]
MQITINGESRDVKEGLTILALLEELELQPDAMVVQRNDHVIEHDAFANTQLEEGDVIELVRFVGGG